MKKLISTVLTLTLLLTSLFAELKPMSRSHIYWDVGKNKEMLVQAIPQDEMNWVKECLFEIYAQKDTLPKDEFKKVVTYEDLYNYLHEYINDNHFDMYCADLLSNGQPNEMKKMWWIRDNKNYDEEKRLRTSERGDYITYTETKNAEYVRNVGKCNLSDSEVLEKIKGNKDFIILDYRSNDGGKTIPMFSLFERLDKMNYKGKIICLQDNYSGSAGELGRFERGNLDVVLVGQNTRGLGVSNGGEYRKYGHFWVHLPNFDCTNDFTIEELNEELRKGNNVFNFEKFEGEGKGYKPDVRVYKNEDFGPTLEKMGVDMIDINTGNKIVIQ